MCTYVCVAVTYVMASPPLAVAVSVCMAVGAWVADMLLLSLLLFALGPAVCRNVGSSNNKMHLKLCLDCCTDPVPEMQPTGHSCCETSRMPTKFEERFIVFLRLLLKFARLTCGVDDSMPAPVSKSFEHIFGIVLALKRVGDEEAELDSCERVQY